MAFLTIAASVSLLQDPAAHKEVNQLLTGPTIESSLEPETMESRGEGVRHAFTSGLVARTVKAWVQLGVRLSLKKGMKSNHEGRHRNEGITHCAAANVTKAETVSDRENMVVKE